MTLGPIAIVGHSGGTNVGESLRRAAVAAGLKVQFFDSSRAAAAPRLVRALSWRFADRRPPRLKRVSNHIVHMCEQLRPQTLLATGSAPLTRSALEAFRTFGIRTANFSTDDPWNPTLRSEWHLEALPLFDLVFTPRRANEDDLRGIGCSNVRYLPFAYDALAEESAAYPHQVNTSDVLFVGGADRDRVDFMKTFIRLGPPITLCGAYWERYRSTRPYAIGHKPYQEVTRLTQAAKVNLCLVRRANRDGHVMRSFEIAAIGACMLVEDSEDHRTFFGADGETVRYFNSPEEAAMRAQSLVASPSERARLAASVQARIRGAPNTYGDRLKSMLEVVSSLNGVEREIGTIR